jgi:hypothetical protein
MTCLCDTHLDDATCRLVVLARLNSGCFDEARSDERHRPASGLTLSPEQWRRDRVGRPTPNQWNQQNGRVA